MTTFTPTELGNVFFSAYAKAIILGHGHKVSKKRAWEWLDGLMLTHEEKKPLWQCFDQMHNGHLFTVNIDVHGQPYTVEVSWTRNWETGVVPMFPTFKKQYLKKIAENQLGVCSFEE